jgi:alpha-glucosidase
MCEFMEPSLLCAMNQLSNHDHSRFLTRTNHRTGRSADYDYDAASENVDPAVMREAVLLQMTWPGAPTIYYGDEAGLTGFTDPDNRRTYPWGREDAQMIAFHKSAIAMRRSRPVLKTGSIKFLGGGYQYIAYARFNEEEQIACLFNNGSEEIEVTVPVWTADVPVDSMMTRIFYTDASSYSTQRRSFPVRHGELSMRLGPRSGVVLSSRAHPQAIPLAGT